jgi:hypothetical protein
MGLCGLFWHSKKFFIAQEEEEGHYLFIYLFIIIIIFAFPLFLLV